LTPDPRPLRTACVRHGAAAMNPHCINKPLRSTSRRGKELLPPGRAQSSIRPHCCSKQRGQMTVSMLRSLLNRFGSDAIPGRVLLLLPPFFAPGSFAAFLSSGRPCERRRPRAASRTRGPSGVSAVPEEAPTAIISRAACACAYWAKGTFCSKTRSGWVSTKLARCTSFSCNFARLG
jgi:hypothetical protein